MESYFHTLEDQHSYNTWYRNSLHKCCSVFLRWSLDSHLFLNECIWYPHFSRTWDKQIILSVLWFLPVIQKSFIMLLHCLMLFTFSVKHNAISMQLFLLTMVIINVVCCLQYRPDIDVSQVFNKRKLCLKNIIQITIFTVKAILYNSKNKIYDDQSI